MALQMAFTDTDGRASPNSYSKVIVSRANIPVTGDPMQEVSVLMFNSKTERDTPPQKQIGMAQYYVRGDEYSTFFALAVLDGAGCNPIKQAYLFLKAHVPAQGEIDFRNASDV